MLMRESGSPILRYSSSSKILAIHNCFLSVFCLWLIDENGMCVSLGWDLRFDALHTSDTKWIVEISQTFIFNLLYCICRRLNYIPLLTAWTLVTVDEWKEIVLVARTCASLFRNRITPALTSQYRSIQYLKVRKYWRILDRNRYGLIVLWQ